MNEQNHNLTHWEIEQDGSTPFLPTQRTVALNQNRASWNCCKMQRCKPMASCQTFSCRHSTYVVSVALTNILKMSSAFLLWQTSVIKDFKPDIDIKDDWTITGAFLIVAPLLFLGNYFFCKPNNTPIRHTNHFTETLEVSAFLYDFLTIIKTPNSLAAQIGMFIAGLFMMLLRNLDPDISILQNNSLNHKLPSNYGQKPLMIGDASILPTEPTWKTIYRYSLRTLHLCIPPIVTGVSTFHVSEFAIHSATHHAHNNIALNIAISHALLTLLVRLYDLKISRGYYMGDPRNNIWYTIAKSENALSVFMLSAFQINYAIGDWLGFFNYMLTDKPSFNSIAQQNLKWSVPFLFVLGGSLAFVAAYDNMDMYEDFFAKQDKLYSCLQNKLQSASRGQNLDTDTDWLKHIALSDNQSNQSSLDHPSFCQNLKATLNDIRQIAQSYFGRKVAKEDQDLTTHTSTAGVKP